MDSHPSNAEEAEENFQDKKSDAVSNFSPRGATPTVLTLFSEALNEKNFDENEEKIFEKHLEFLVGGPFDLELRNVRQNRVNVKLMLELTDLCPPKIQVWSTFVGIVKKNVQTWTEEDDQLYNVLIQTTQQIFDHPAILVPAFELKKVVCIIFDLIGSPNELIKIPALKMFGYYLCRSTQKLKNLAISQRSLFYLLTDKLMLNCHSLSLATYNALFEILVELFCPEIYSVRREDLPIENTRFENPQILKVVAQLLIQSEESSETLRVKKIFLKDLIRHCEACSENKRIILQMSVWQEWLISLSYIYPENEEQKNVSELVFQLFSILSFHAIRFKKDGWRVWVDTMAIAHSKVSWQKYRKTQKQEEDARKKLGQNLNSNDQSSSSGGGVSSRYRTPDFVWSQVQIQFLNDLLMSIRAVVQEWKDSPSPIADYLNNSDNQLFITNTVHLFSQHADSLVMACGGLLPLLAAATSPTSELKLFDTTQQELDISDAAYFLEIFAEIADVFIFTSPLTLNELEQEKNMPAGGILRQAFRLSATSAVLRILSSILSNNESIIGSEINSTKYEAIREFIKNKSTNVEFKDQLLQTMDLQRLKNLIYRDKEEVEQAQFLALSVVYFLSVLLAAYCGDILEPCNDKLQKSIEPVISLLREILCDFRSFLQKTLLGTHGQEIMNDKVMHTLKNVSVIEILCSQEWQTSLQKHFELEFMELVNEGFILSVPNKILGQFKMSSLPPEIQFDVLKCLDFEQLFFLYQNNFYFYNLINLYEGVLARKKFCSFSLTGAIFSSHHILKSNEVPSFILNDQLKEKWQTALEESITLFLQPDTTDPLQPARPFFSLFSHGPRRVKNVFVELRLKEDFFILKLPNYPKTIEELIIIRSWLEQLFDCGFGNAVFGDIIFNPQMINLLFDNDKIKKFNVHSLTLHTQNITDNILDFALNRFAIYLSFNINFASGNTDILFNIINEGKKVPHVIFTNCQSSEFYNRVIKHIRTSNDFSKIVPACDFFYNRLENFKLPTGTKLIGTEHKYNREYTKYQISNIYNPKMKFYLSINIGPPSSFIIRK